MGWYARVSLVLVCGSLLACGDGSDGPQPEPEPPVPTPAVTGPVEPVSGFFTAGTAFDTQAVGYRAEEYFVSGTARAYVNTSELLSDGRWSVEPGEEAPYTTRIVVYRPLEPADFSGTVVVEWLNVTAGLDSAPDWILGHVETLRRGHVYVLVSAQKAGIDGRGGGFGLHLKAVNPDRYGELDHPGDSFSYDLFSQVIQSLRTPPADGADPLDGLRPERVIATGHSQSGFRLITYVNALANEHGVVDGFIVHGRGFSSARLSQEPQLEIPPPASVRVRDDLEQPVLILQSETDVLLLGSLPDRQPDSDKVRTWEMAGTSHFDLYGLLFGPLDVGDDPEVMRVLEVTDPIPGFVSCPLPVNAGPQHLFYRAGLNGLDRWIRGGDPLPAASPLDIADGKLVLDALGNAQGGLRSPYVDAPVAVLSGLGQDGGGFCRLYGTTALFDEALLAQLYATQADYEEAVRASLELQVEAGFILAEDADLVLRAAQSSTVR
jgi:hypothetical protein